LNESRRLLAAAASVPAQPLEAAARQRLALADVEYLRDDYDAALAQLRSADKVIASAGADGVPLRSRLWMAYGDVYLRLDDAPRARDYFERALASTAHPGTDDAQLAAGALQGIAQVEVGADNFVAAETRLLEALRLQISATGELHPRTSEILNELGSLEYMRHRTKAAAGYFRRVIAIDRRVLGEHHPDLAITLNNLARVELEQRQFTAARDSLKEAVAMRAGETLATGELMTFLYGNLGLAYLGLGDYAAARGPLEQGLQAATVNKHRMHGPILADLGDLDCRTGHYREGLEKLEEARPLMAASYPDDPWRTALVDNIRGACLLGLQRLGEAEPLLTRSAPILLARWRPESLYGHDVVQRMTELSRAMGNPPELVKFEALSSGY
jgi:tetratricopeptide (TPR) repeat protein